MKISIIDNGSRYLSELVNFAKDNASNEVQVLELQKLNTKDLDESDLVILSGGHKDPVSLNPEKYQTEIDFVKSTDKPVLGVCLGFEIIAYAFGSELERMHNKESKILSLKWLAQSPISDLFNSVDVQEHHRWRIKKLSNKLFPLAESEDGIEIIKHIDKPIFGFQFHPELNSSVNPSVFKKFSNYSAN
jgi:GMP synthase (glutamine-hydrolysing)